MIQEEIDAIALGFIKGVGHRIARKITNVVPSISDLFLMSEKELVNDVQLSQSLAQEILSSRNSARQEAEKEVEWTEKYGVNILTFNSPRYPSRLRSCDDSPAVLYAHGNADYNVRRVLSVVGTRRPSAYGRQWCSDVLTELASRNPDLLIVSGLAYGIDVTSHISALDNNLPTVGVVAHGLDLIYPSQHKEIARRMVLQNGAVLTEFRRGVQPEAANFVMRNRIVAGMSDATLVVESGSKGGSLITAAKAYEYNRKVLALPGSPAAEMSAGPNMLIRDHRAELVTSAEDIETFMHWGANASQGQHPQGALFASPDLELDPVQSRVCQLLGEGELTVDELSRALSMPLSDLSPRLLEMEFQGLISSLPGNRFKSQLF